MLKAIQGLTIIALLTFMACCAVWLIRGGNSQYQLVSTSQGIILMETSTGQLELISMPYKRKINLIEYNSEVAHKGPADNFRQRLTQAKQTMDQFAKDHPDSRDIESENRIDNLWKLVNDSKFVFPDEWKGKSIIEIQELIETERNNPI